MSKLVSFTFIPIIPIIPIFLLLASTDARAGMLHTQRFSMLDVHDAGAPIALGTVVALRATSTSVRDVVLELRVKRVFPGKEPEWTSWTPGAVVKVPLYGGVEWVDPNVSPLEHRVFGHVGAAKAGDDVIVVFDIHSGQAQMIAATPARLRAATIIYDAAARTQYADEPRARLEADLADDHLVMLALAALERHGGPSTAALLRMRWDLRTRRFAAMGGAARKRFFADVARLARKDRAVLRSVQSDDTSTRGQSDILAAIARIGAAVIEASPSSKSEVTRIVDAARAKAPRASLPATALTATRAPAQEQTVTIGYGEQLRLQNGTEINHLSDTPLITASCDPGSGGSGGGSLSYTSSTGYREWWACGYLMHIEDEPHAKKRIRIRAQPMPIAPAKMSFEAARALAEKALEGRGCTGSSSTEQDGDRGWLRYSTSTCTVLMGMYSRKVIQVNAPAGKPSPAVAPR